MKRGDRVVVSVVDVSRTIDGRTARRRCCSAPVSVDLHAGTLVAVSGPSGSGKTTLCNIIIGWERSDTGSIQWADDEAESWARLAVAPQRLALLPSLDIRENLALPFWSSGIDLPEPELDDLARTPGDRRAAPPAAVGGVVRRAATCRDRTCPPRVPAACRAR